MARLVRGDLFDPAEVSAFHCMSRCVRRSFLCGDDPYSGRNYDHRKAWLQHGYGTVSDRSIRPTVGLLTRRL